MPLLAFSPDASITIEEHGSPDRVLDRSDSLAILDHLRSAVRFEAGLTAAHLMRALRPWSQVLSRLAWCDFGAWDAAMAVPRLCLVGSEAEAGTRMASRLAAVVISPVFHGCVRRRGAPTAFIDWQVSGRLPQPDDDGNLYCRMSLMRPAEWAHLPLEIDPRLWLGEIDHAIKGRRILDAGFASTSTEPSELETWTSFFATVVLGFLDDVSFFGDPDDAEDARDMLEGRLAEAGLIAGGSGRAADDAMNGTDAGPAAAAGSIRVE